MKISAIIQTKNEENMIEEALTSLDWIDEIVLIDDGSTDKTVQLAKKFKNVKFLAPSDNKVAYSEYSVNKNLAALKTETDWLFFMDADERVTDKLRDEILTITSSENAKNAYAIPRQNNFLGKNMRWGGWWPDYVIRLIRKQSFEGFVGELHEQPRFKGELGYLKNPLTHITHRTLEEMVAKTNKWSNAEAKLLFDAGHPPMAWWRFISIAAREFWYRAILKLGFLDGMVGVIEIIYQMYSRMITYAKLWEMQENKK